MRKLTGTSPFHPERVGPSCMTRFFETDAAGVCVALILSVNQSAVSLGWFWAMARSYPMTRSATTSCSPSSWEDLDARRSHWSSVVWTSRPLAIRASSGSCAEHSSCPASVTSCAHLALNCAWVVVAIYIWADGRVYLCV